VDIGIGLPTAIPGLAGGAVAAWARAAEAAGFASIAATDRLAGDTFEPLMALAAAGAVTSGVRLVSAVVVAPLRTNTALLAKQAATIDRMTGGRLVLGVGVGGREEDYHAAGLDGRTRGRVLDRQLDDLLRFWADDSPVGPRPVAGPPRLLVGGAVDAAILRAARRGDGWIGGGGDPRRVAATAAALARAWEAEGRAGAPRVVALVFFALGDDATGVADGFLRGYYGPGGGAVTATTDAAAVRRTTAAFAGVGCDELIYLPCAADPDQIHRLAAALWG
jgi:alkanesulfonate monooxygenase SsuD/methylene tetrahydromethanopterin reductase-like flavin-dependent oxidoreductase (luciferase family)